MSILSGIMEAARAYYEETGRSLEELRVPMEDWHQLTGEVARKASVVGPYCPLYVILQSVSGAIVVRPR